ncbi:3-oxoacyl-[acyl-carrier protein] reductase [Sporobacter termitidis DSM 10068]|uniref:3-oxoacyl-[acyl-carrier protein] reductase n=1 Tax=Sporobacter termitidis DSM 10068 TaxID=1123282 RepID=A0A1M5YN48_9FIRM|nr:SDR family NAD(P)-dependent oxidoreductase [Sporobacter termitidis]SHI13370.1 3-oxoacyl-[acyl-carrier protein] reductase [Sporobacter termitidis DSM 10068]
MVDYGISGKVAAVTGAGKGIGRETAIQLAKQGAAVALIGRSMSSLSLVEEEIRAFSNDVSSVECDVSCEESVNRAVGDIINKSGRIDILVNNAGIEADREPGQMGGDILMTTSVEQYHKVLDTNLIGHYNFLRAVIPHMQEQKFGRIVNVSSVTAFNGGVGSAAYVASKAGIIVQTKAFARQFGPDNIIINTVCPGMIDTPMHATTPKENFETVARMVPLRRVGKPADVAKLILFLAQEDLYMAGETIAVDGGGSMR